MNEILQILIEQWKYDIATMSQWWMYYCVFPILFYVPFFFMKWAILTAPVWLPLRLMLGKLSFVPAIKVKLDDKTINQLKKEPRNDAGNRE